MSSPRRYDPCVLASLVICCILYSSGASCVGNPANASANAAKTAAAILKDTLRSGRKKGELPYTWSYITESSATVGAPTRRITSDVVAFRAKWQPGAYYLMQLRSPGNLASPMRSDVRAIVGHVGRVRWAYQNGILEAYGDDLNEVASNAASNHLHWAQSQLYYVLGFGILHCPGTLQWSDNNFAAERLGGGMIEGRMVCRSTDVPESFVLEPRTGNRPRQIVDLVYDERGVSGVRHGLPRTLVKHSIDPDGIRKPFARVEIQTISFTNTVEPEADFLPEAVLAALEQPGVNRTWMTVIHTNAKSFFVRSNRLYQIQGSMPAPDAVARGAFFIAALVTFGSIVTLFLRSKRRQKKGRHVPGGSSQITP